MSKDKEKKEVKLDVSTDDQAVALKEANDKYLRALADYQNLLKQTEKEKSDFYAFALGDLLFDLLPIYDHLQLAIKGLSETEEKSPWVTGVKHVIKQLSDLLSEKGIEVIKTTAEKFDPECMEAISGQGDKVDQEVKAGYRLRGKVLIPAKVTVKE